MALGILCEFFYIVYCLFVNLFVVCLSVCVLFIFQLSASRPDIISKHIRDARAKLTNLISHPSSMQSDRTYQAEKIRIESSLEAQIPPEDFRTLSIFPTNDDLVDEQFCRPNKVKGGSLENTIFRNFL